MEDYFQHEYITERVKERLNTLTLNGRKSITYLTLFIKDDINCM